MLKATTWPVLLLGAWNCSVSVAGLILVLSAYAGPAWTY